MLLALNEDAVPHVNSLSLAKLSVLHQQSVYLGVARDAAGAVAGFLLALGENADYASENYRYFQRRYPRFLYVDRIAVSAGYQRAGVGTALYRGLLAACAADYPLLACEVNLRPPNPTSLAFHQRMGFKPIGEQDTEKGSKCVCMMVMSLAKDVRRPISG